MVPVLTDRTQEEIIARIGEDGWDDFLGHGKTDLVGYLDYDHAKPYLKEGVTKEGWENDDGGMERRTPLERIKEYMPFAVEKAIGHRGISASRSVGHMEAWVWLLGDYDKIHWSWYANYGAPILKEICELYGIDLPEHDVWPDNEHNSEWCYRCKFDRMANGKPCRDDCEEGCGR